MKTSKITFKENVNGDWHWVSVSSNGRMIAKSSESYSRLQKAQEGFNLDCKIRLDILQIPMPKDVERLGGDFLALIPKERVKYIRK